MKITVLPGHGRKEAEARLSLSSSHIEGGGILTYAKGGRLARLRGITGGTNFARPTIRGKIRGFSEGSRGRMLDRLNSVDPAKMAPHAKFVTLTYPEEYSGDWRDWKNDLKQLHDVLRSVFGEFCAMWRMEFQERGAPHFHLLVWIEHFIPWEFLRAEWSLIVNKGNLAKQWVRTGIERMRSWGGAVWYCAKYVGKRSRIDEERGESGRHWGCWGGKLWGIELVKVVVTREEFRALRDEMLRIRHKGREVAKPEWDLQGCRCFMGNDQLKMLMYEVLDLGTA